MTVRGVHYVDKDLLYSTLVRAECVSVCVAYAQCPLYTEEMIEENIDEMTHMILKGYHKCSFLLTTESTIQPW